MKKKSLKALKKEADILFAQIVRNRGRCQKSGRTNNLQCAHFHSRSKLSVRWDFGNAFCLNAGVHLFWAHKEPGEYTEWVRMILGEENYIALNERARETKQWKLWELEALVVDLKYMLLERNNAN